MKAIAWRKFTDARLVQADIFKAADNLMAKLRAAPNGLVITFKGTVAKIRSDDRESMVGL